VAGLWHMPSGKLEPGESAVDAVIREAREEIGVELDALRCAALTCCTSGGPARRPG
jgi:8-oxo-dGTP diphosphatase